MIVSSIYLEEDIAISSLAFVATLIYLDRP